MKNEIIRQIEAEYIQISHLHHHPGNPRRDIGDITELTESIKKNGIMQNLTVIPGYYGTNGDFQESVTEYTVIIGHRRLEAAKAAGLSEVPCRIYENLSESEQITTMLEENMQRNDLTPIEQAQSFQLCLDLGETVDTLSEKTGFAKSTIHHRLNIAKLDQERLKELEEDNGFQLTITDLIELEKIKSIEKRNEVLNNSKSSNDLRFQAEQAAKSEKREELEADARKVLEDRGLREGVTSDRWSGKYDTLYRHNMLENNYTNDFIIPEDIEEQIEDGAVYLISYGEVTILNPVPEKDEEEEPSEYKESARDRNERKDKYNEIHTQMKTKTRDFVLDIISGKIKKETETDLTNDLLNMLLFEDIWFSKDDILEFLDEELDTRDEETDEYQDAIKNAKELPAEHKVLALITDHVNDIIIMNWDGRYNQPAGKEAMDFYHILENWGYRCTDDEQQLINGTAEYYKEDDED